MRNIFFSFSFKDFVLICYGKVLNRLNINTKYFDKYLPIIDSIKSYNERGYVVRVYEKSLLLEGKGEFKRFRFLLRPLTSDEKVFSQVIEEKEYSPLIDIILKYNLLKDIETIIDAGANVGFTSIFFKSLFPFAKVVCIEPDRLNFAQLENNIKINSLSRDVQVLNKALWYNENDTLFIKNDFRDGDSWSKSVGVTSKNENDYEVSSVVLKSIIEENNFDRIDILKVDIEGAETKLFYDNNFVDCLSEKVKFLAIEIHDELGARDIIESKLMSNHFEIHREGETNFCFNKKMV